MQILQLFSGDQIGPSPNTNVGRTGISNIDIAAALFAVNLLNAMAARLHSLFADSDDGSAPGNPAIPLIKQVPDNDR